MNTPKTSWRRLSLAIASLAVALPGAGGAIGLVGCAADSSTGTSHDAVVLLPECLDLRDDLAFCVHDRSGGVAAEETRAVAHAQCVADNWAMAQLCCAHEDGPGPVASPSCSYLDEARAYLPYDSYVPDTLEELTARWRQCLATAPDGTACLPRWESFDDPIYRKISALCPAIDDESDENGQLFRYIDYRYAEGFSVCQYALVPPIYRPEAAACDNMGRSYDLYQEAKAGHVSRCWPTDGCEAACAASGATWQCASECRKDVAREIECEVCDAGDSACIDSGCGGYRDPVAAESIDSNYNFCGQSDLYISDLSIYDNVSIPCCALNAYGFCRDTSYFDWQDFPWLGDKDNFLHHSGMHTLDWYSRAYMGRFVFPDEESDYILECEGSSDKLDCMKRLLDEGEKRFRANQGMDEGAEITYDDVVAAGETGYPTMAELVALCEGPGVSTWACAAFRLGEYAPLEGGQSYEVKEYTCSGIFGDRLDRCEGSSYLTYSSCWGPSAWSRYWPGMSEQGLYTLGQQCCAWGGFHHEACDSL